MSISQKGKHLAIVEGLHLTFGMHFVRPQPLACSVTEMGC